ncbi:hypothetical protein [Nocardia higoensis]|nr:hypothetical protein [Nocardia higoensis]
MTRTEPAMCRIAPGVLGHTDPAAVPPLGGQRGVTPVIDAPDGVRRRMSA